MTRKPPTVERIKPDEVIQPDIEEAKAATLQARNGAYELWEGLARIVKCHGWTVLGYANFRQWARAELDMSLQSADLYLRKTNTLIELAQTWKAPLGEIAKTVPLRNGHRKPPRGTPISRSMMTAARKLEATVIFTSPDERAAAERLRTHLTRLLAE